MRCISFVVTALFYQGAPGPRGQKGVVGDWGEDKNILVVVDPATGTKAKDFCCLGHSYQQSVEQCWLKKENVDWR